MRTARSVLVLLTPYGGRLGCDDVCLEKNESNSDYEPSRRRYGLRKRNISEPLQPIKEKKPIANER